jgi:hypothetical protein
MATGATVNYSLPYPLPTDQVDVAGDIEQLAAKIDNDLQEIIEDKTAAMFTGGTVSNGFTLPVYNDSTGKMTLTLAQDIQTSASPTFNSLNLNGSVIFEGATADAYETTLAVVDPTADRTITLPDVTGTVITTGDSGSITSAMILDGTIANGDISSSAAIVDTKLDTISTTGKVSNSATTATSSNTNSAIVARDSSGNFSAGTITASLTGVASKATNMTGGNSTTLLGSIGYQSNTDTTTLLSPNTTITKKFLRQTGDGTNGAVPAWDTLINGDIPSALSGKTYEGITISSTTGTFTLTNSKTFAVQNSITLAGTDSTTITLPATTGTVALNNQTMYVGTTSLAINRSSASQTLSGVSIDGNSGTVTNGVYTTSTYSNPAWITGLAWSKISSTPTTLAGYGITDAASSTGTFYIGTTSIGINRASASQTLTGVSIDGNSATVTNGVYTSGTYSNPSWITGLAWSKISSTPTTLAGYGITDATGSSGTFYLGTTSIALNRSSANLGLTGISSVAFPGASSGTSTLQAPSVAGTATITLPSSTGTLALTSDLSSYAALSGATFTGTVITATPTTSISSIRLPHGSAPTSPTNGDVWTTSAGIYVQINNATVGPLGTGSGGSSGGGTASLQDILMFAGM